MYNVLSFFHHLAFSNPKSSFCNSNGKIIDFNSVELIDRNLNRTQILITKRNLSMR